MCRIWNAEIHSKTNFFILEARLAAAELMTVSPKLYNRPSEVSFHVLFFKSNILDPYETSVYMDLAWT